MSVPHKNLITSLLSFCFGVLAILFVIPLYASGFIGGLIIIPLAAIFAITLGFIGLRKTQKRNHLADCRYCYGFYQSRKPNAIVVVLSCLYLTGGWWEVILKSIHLSTLNQWIIKNDRLRNTNDSWSFILTKNIIWGLNRILTFKQTI